MFSQKYILSDFLITVQGPGVALGLGLNSYKDTKSQGEDGRRGGVTWTRVEGRVLW